MFKKDDYIVCLSFNEKISTACVKNNFIFKIRIDNKAIYPTIDLKGSGINGNSTLSFDKNQNLLDWRYAFIEEIEEYKRINKPFDINNVKINYKHDYLIKLMESLNIK